MAYVVPDQPADLRNAENGAWIGGSAPHLISNDTVSSDPNVWYCRLMAPTRAPAGDPRVRPTAPGTLAFRSRVGYCAGPTGTRPW